MLLAVTDGAYLFAGVIVSSVFALSTTVITIWLKTDLSRVKSHVSQVNDAVNNRHAGQPKAYDLMLLCVAHCEELLAWKRSHDNSPFRDGRAAQQFVDDTRGQIQELRRLVQNHGCEQ